MRTRTGKGLRDRLAVVLGIALISIWFGRVTGLSSAAITLTTLGLPVLTWVLLGRFPARGVLSGVSALLLGVLILGMQPAGVPIGWGDAAILGLLLPIALVGSQFAGSMRVPNHSAPPALKDGRWHTIIVAGQGPAPGAGRSARLPRMPRNDPERRRLSRRVERRCELVSSAVDG